MCVWEVSRLISKNNLTCAAVMLCMHRGDHCVSADAGANAFGVSGGLLRMGESIAGFRAFCYVRWIGDWGGTGALARYSFNTI